MAAATAAAADREQPIVLIVYSPRSGRGGGGGRGCQFLGEGAEGGCAEGTVFTADNGWTPGAFTTRKKVRQGATWPTPRRREPTDKDRLGVLLSEEMAALAATVFASLFVGRGRGRGRGGDPILPVSVAEGRQRTATATARDPIAAIRMPRSFTDHTLHCMETGRMPPAVVVSVRSG